jgi:hypothetical protein
MHTRNGPQYAPFKWGKTMKQINLVALALILAGCASGYQQFYRPNPVVTPERLAVARANPPPAAPLVDHIGAFTPTTLRDYLTQGYFEIGYSSFTSGRSQNESGAVEQGKQVGADLVVLIDPSYAGSASTVIPVVTPHNSTSYTTGTATAYGSGGSATAYGSAVTTTYGTQTNYVPMTIERFAYGALYFVRTKMGVGIFTANLTDEMRQTLQSNHGLIVAGVRQGSPAFESDILVGDIVVAADDEVFSTDQEFGALLKKHAGQQVMLKIYRNGQYMSKALAVPVDYGAHH